MNVSEFESVRIHFGSNPKVLELKKCQSRNHNFRFWDIFRLKAILTEDSDTSDITIFWHFQVLGDSDTFMF